MRYAYTLILCYFVVTSAFLIVRNQTDIVTTDKGEKIVVNRTHDFFPLSNSKCTIVEYIYYLGEHLGLIVLALLWRSETRYKSLSTGLLLAFLVDLVDYTLTYNAVWYSLNFKVSDTDFLISKFTLSINNLKYLIIGFFSVKQWKNVME